jgi:elongation factor 3
MTGEHKPDTGSQVWRHPNLRLAYVAQHAFHHLEEHLDTTPLKYMFHRCAPGGSRRGCCETRGRGPA